MAKVFGVKELEDKVRATFNNTIRSNSNLRYIATLVKDRIYQTVKTGYSMAGGEKHRLAPLSASYKKYRAKYQTIYKTGEFFSPSRSNLTFTGQMLNALDFKIVKTNLSGGFEIFVKNSLRQATNAIDKIKTAKSLLSKKTRRNATRALNDRSGASSERLTNADVAAQVSENGRPFIGVDERTIQRIRSEVIKDLRRAISIKGLRK